jgi:hypothetical protein
MSEVVQFTVKRKDRNDREFSSWSSSSFDLTTATEAVLNTLGSAMLQNHGYCHFSIINELTHRADYHSRLANEQRDQIASRKVRQFLDEHLNEVLVDPSVGWAVITNAIDLEDVTEGRIWFDDTEFKVTDINSAYQDLMCLATLYANDIKLEIEADHNEHMSKHFKASADNFTAGRIVISTARGPQFVYCSRTEK